MHRASFLERLLRVCSRLNLTLDQAADLSKSDLSAISLNLWQRCFVTFSSDTRYRHFKLVQPSVLPTHPVLSSSLPRFPTSIFHGLRLGSAPLNAFLHSIQCSESSACLCGAAETVSHYLLLCPNYRRQRAALRAQLRQILGRRHPLSLRLLLSNPLNLSRAVHLRVIRAVCAFISTSGRFSRRLRR